MNKLHHVEIQMSFCKKKKKKRFQRLKFFHADKSYLEKDTRFLSSTTWLSVTKPPAWRRRTESTRIHKILHNGRQNFYVGCWSPLDQQKTVLRHFNIELAKGL